MPRTRDSDSLYDLRLLVDNWLFEEARTVQVSIPCSGSFSSDLELMQTFDVDKRKVQEE